ncbi:uncharacterized protein J3D65DRAFT_356741 [Phyllosticta citribraziliensis]|uniref:Uncharacterized protein n=1 Tax=Phyllosticta citribraziliensis TaxID=989973 RepID=A0ABR1LNY2_9PEZI
MQSCACSCSVCRYAAVLCFTLPFPVRRRSGSQSFSQLASQSVSQLACLQSIVGLSLSEQLQRGGVEWSKAKQRRVKWSIITLLAFLFYSFPLPSTHHRKHLNSSHSLTSPFSRLIQAHRTQTQHHQRRAPANRPAGRHAAPTPSTRRLWDWLDRTGFELMYYSFRKGGQGKKGVVWER